MGQTAIGKSTPIFRVISIVSVVRSVSNVISVSIVLYVV